MLKENHTFSMTILSYPTFTVSAAASSTLFSSGRSSESHSVRVCVNQCKIDFVAAAFYWVRARNAF